MKFGENLQKLRKEKKISQEQLAEQLGVTRQSVSKWESNTSYPEMDKLVSICKIFNCDLDSLINKDISDELNKKEASGIVKNIFKEAMSYIEKTVRLFEQKSFKEIIKIIAQIILIIIIIFLFSIPFQLIEGTISNAFYLENNYISHFFNSLCEFIFNGIYVVLAIIAFLYIFKIKFLEEYSDLEIKDTKNIEISKEDKIVEKTQKVITKTIRENTLTDILVKLITIFIKFCLLLFLIPVVITMVSLIIELILLVIMLFKGVLLLGPIICLIAGVILSILIIELILNFTFNLKYSKRRVIITFITSLVLGSIGLGLSIWYFINLNIINDSPAEYKKASIEEKIAMTDDLKFHQVYDDIEYIADENLNNEVLVKVEYNENCCNKMSLRMENTAYMIDCDYNESFNGKKIINSIIKDLKNHKLYTYSNYSTVKLIIRTQQANIDKIIKNQDEWYSSNYEEDDYE